MEFPGEKLVIKMWETLTEKGIGSALQPWHEKRLGEAKNQVRRNEIIMLAEAEKMAADIKAGRLKPIDTTTPLISVSAQERIEPTISLPDIAITAANINVSETIRKEVNVSKAVLAAENILANEEQEVPTQNVEDDWLYSWRENAGKVSSEELQDLWGRILAGEIKNPGSYSFRTMEFLKGLSKDEAELISKLAQFVVDGSIFRHKDTFLEQSGISFNTLLFLQEIGVVAGVEATGLHVTWNSLLPNSYMKALVSNNKVIVLEHDDVNKKADAGVYQLTSVGRQVLALASFGSRDDYLLSIAQDYVKKGYKVKLGDWRPLNATRGQILNPQEVKV
ncbi:DUF2806 domain-containing protein [Shewanella pealeana]|uniref:Membrane-fusion protein n=1 Tax=Shewanella pealeana (strain ATCC 700345 / ANG-SQ1) TaxID=398579 RepID=A8HA23_SHEPA|nr:DUF2806 domain-containing protein [Shewanella pealeana]ABV89410.1 membrane-fusion protein [Shewanella pealeana ATCC 700345]